MIPRGVLFWLLIVLASGFTTFKVKYTVQDIEDELNKVRKQTVAEQQEIRVLTAEWTYLNEPERLADLNRRFLQLAGIAPKQLQQKIADMAMRPAPPPDTLVAANPPPAAPQSAMTAPPVVAVSAAASAPAAAVAVNTAAPVRPAVAEPAAPLHLAKADQTRAIGSLDDLIAQIAEAR